MAGYKILGGRDLDLPDLGIRQGTYCQNSVKLTKFHHLVSPNLAKEGKE